MNSFLSTELNAEKIGPKTAYSLTSTGLWKNVQPKNDFLSVLINWPF
jgi:hypothetical protein